VSQLQKVPPVAKHKTITHLPAAPPPPAPRLVAQLLVAAGELLVLSVCVVGVVTVVGWIIAWTDRRAPGVQRPPLEQARLVCWIDRRYGEMCEPAYRSPPMPPHYARDFY
jgi:hypothetical protein